MNRFAVVALLIISCCFSSCSFLRSVTGRKSKGSDTASLANTVDTSRLVIPSPVVPDTVKKVLATPAPSKQLIDSLTPLWKNRLVYKTFSGKAKMHFDGPDQKQEFTAHIRMRKDSVIWINITALSGMVQAARILITPDSFFMINYQDQEVTKVALKDAGKILPTKVDFSSLQNFIAGDPLRDGTITNASAEPGKWSVEVNDTDYIQQYTYSKKDSTLLTAQLSTHNSAGPKAFTLYSNYAVIDKRRISTLRTLNIQKGADNYSLDMNFGKIDFDLQWDYPFSIPANYTVKEK